MPDRRNNKRRGDAAAVSIGSQVWARVTARPVDSLAMAGTGLIALVIVVNAVFMQAGAKPAQYVAAPGPTPAVSEIQTKQAATGTLRSADLAPARGTQVASTTVPMPVPAPARRSDPIADLIGPSPRIQAVQRVLSEFGYGQIKPSGVLDNATSEAISRFERDHKLPVSGRISDRLVSALNAMAGHSIE